MITEEQANELKELCKPVAEWLRKNRSPHDFVRIDAHGITLAVDEYGDNCGEVEE